MAGFMSIELPATKQDETWTWEVAEWYASALPVNFSVVLLSNSLHNIWQHTITSTIADAQNSQQNSWDDINFS